MNPLNNSDALAQSYMFADNCVFHFLVLSCIQGGWHLQSDVLDLSKIIFPPIKSLRNTIDNN
jgi:hypothetical protein